jgi:hypothetical protein
MCDVNNEQMQDLDVLTSCRCADTIQIQWIQDCDVSTSSHIKPHYKHIRSVGYKIQIHIQRSRYQDVEASLTSNAELTSDIKTILMHLHDEVHDMCNEAAKIQATEATNAADRLRVSVAKSEWIAAVVGSWDTCVLIRSICNSR